MVDQLDVVTKTYDLILWTLPQVAKFPRSHRFTLGERIETLILGILQGLIAAQYRKKKLPLLYDLNVQLEQLRFLIRLAKDLKLLGMRRYEHAAEQIDATGRLLGGWVKQQERGE